MPEPDGELVARLEAAAKAAIAKVLAERKPPAEATLADIEQVALGHRPPPSNAGLQPPR